MSNVIFTAIQAAQEHIAALTKLSTTRETRSLELKKLSKAELIELILDGEKFQGVKIEDMVKPILEDSRCAWLDYDTIATLIKEAVPTASTSAKSLASYASKYPKEKNWIVHPRKTVAERQAAIMSISLAK